MLHHNHIFQNTMEMLSKAESKLMDSSAQKKLSLLQGYEGFWFKARRENSWYITNKIASMILGLIFAVITISFKFTTYEYEEAVKSITDDKESHEHRQLFHL